MHQHSYSFGIFVRPKGAAHSAEISPGQTVRLETWWANDDRKATAPEVECYYWCRDEDGFLPRPPPDAAAVHKELETLVRDSGPKIDSEVYSALNHGVRLSQAR